MTSCRRNLLHLILWKWFKTFLCLFSGTRYNDRELKKLAVPFWLNLVVICWWQEQNYVLLHLWYMEIKMLNGKCLLQFSLRNPEMNTIYISKAFFFYSPNDYYFLTVLLYHGLIKNFSTAKSWYTHRLSTLCHTVL